MKSAFAKIKKIMGFIKEFKDFAMKGNVMDMAVGVIIGGAFGKIVSSLVDNVFMPVVGIITGGVDLSKLSVKVSDAEVKYGLFLQNVIDFIIIALCVFLMIKTMNKFSFNKKKDTSTPVAPPQPSNEEKLLTEIRDLLKQKN